LDWLLVDTSSTVWNPLVHSISISEHRAKVEQLAIERELIRKQEKQQSRLQILEHLASGWYHRNDPNTTTTTTSTGNKQEQPEDANHIHDEQNAKKQTETKSNSIETDQRRNVAAAADPKGIDQHAAAAVATPTTMTTEHAAPVQRMKRPSVPVQDFPTAIVEQFQQQHKEQDHHSNHRPRILLRTLYTMDNPMISNNSHCPANLEESHISTTLVIQSSLNRVWVLEETCRRWKDPIVAVVTVTGEEHRLGLGSSLSGWKDKCPQLELIVYRLDKETEQSPEQYPINRLRNMALDSVETSHIFVVDVDFVPSENLHETIRSALQNLSKRKNGNDETNDAVVVPAFERVLKEPCTSDADCKQHLRLDSSFIPRTFEDLKRCYGSKECIVFQSANNWEGHSSTRSLEWLNGRWYDDDSTDENNQKGNDTRTIRSIECFDSLRYEPYVVIRWCPTEKQASAAQVANGQRALDYENASDAMNNRKHDLQPLARPIAPYYDERFHGYGKNKIQHVSHLRILGYQFRVLPEGFIVHNPHLESKVKETWNDEKESTLHQEMDDLYGKYLRELVDKYIKGSDNMSQKIVGPCKKLK
jgi:hypothetical protein